MPARRISIGQVMMGVALAAVNLAIVRAMPSEVIMYPAIWVVLGSIDFVITWKLVLSRSFQAFHYTFLIVFVVGFFVIAYLVATERLHPLGLIIRWYQQLTAATVNSISLGLLNIGEIWMACFLSFTLACGAGLTATWLERRRGWDIAAFLRGALVGFGIANLLVMIESAVWGWEVVSPARLIGRLVVLATCMILGGILGLTRMKSTA